MAKDAATIIEEEVRRLSEVIAAIEQRAKEGDTTAVDRLVKLSKERARLAQKLQPLKATVPKAPEAKPAVKLSERHRRFVEAYMGEAAGNASEAARIAGYKRLAKSAGAEALRHPAVRAAIEDRQRGDPLIATREERQRFWSSVARGEPQVQLINGQAAMVVPSMRDRLLAAQHLGKSSGDFYERIKHEGSVAHEIVVVELPNNARGDR